MNLNVCLMVGLSVCHNFLLGRGVYDTIVVLTFKLKCFNELEKINIPALFLFRQM